MNRKSCKRCTCGRKLKYNLESIPAQKEAINRMSTGFNSIKSFATSMISRGLTNKKADIPIKQLRVLSCFGDGKTIPRCEHLEQSTTEGKYYCGGCGCGDKPRTWLMSEGNEYSKLDYPKLNCPLKMPGFSNYQAESHPTGSRKFLIEDFSVSSLNKIQVSSPDPPEIKDQ